MGRRGRGGEVGLGRDRGKKGGVGEGAEGVWGGEVGAVGD